MTRCVGVMHSHALALSCGFCIVELQVVPTVACRTPAHRSALLVMFTGLPTRVGLTMKE